MFSSRCGWIALTLLSLSGVSAYGGVIYSTGFEGPTYTPGNIVGQDGWAEFNPTDSFDAVQTTFVKSGAQAAWVIPVGTSIVQTGMFHNNSTTGPLIELSADIFLASSSTQNEWQFAGLGAGLTPFLGGIDVFADDSIHLLTAGFAAEGTLSRNVWNHVDLLFNMTTQKYDFSLNGTSVATGVAFCGDNGPCLGGTVTSYGSSFFDVFATLNSNDLGAIDNLSLSTVTSGVPEPVSRLLIASGLALVVTRRHMTAKKG
jgi:hypothetical protein